VDEAATTSDIKGGKEMVYFAPEC